MSEEAPVPPTPAVALIGDDERAGEIATLCREVGIELVDADAADVIGICTAGDAVTPVAARMPRPECCAGLHLVSGFGGKAALVEIVAAEQTTSATMEALRAFVTSARLESVTTKDRPGFLVRRLVMPYLNQAIQALDDGIATADDIDLSVVLGLGYPVGPLRLLDGLGLEAHHQATTAVSAELGDQHYTPPPMLTRLVEAGFLGRSSGRGFHSYQETTTS